MIRKRPGLEGTRGNLYTYFLEFVKRKQPKAFIAENVKGLLSANKHQAIQRIISDFESISPGYLVKAKLYWTVQSSRYKKTFPAKSQGMVHTG